MEKMRAAVIGKYGEIEYKEVAMPDLPEDQVMIRVRYASICGSDQHIFKGEFHPRTTLPLIPGHEFTGVIAAVGKEVRGFSPGEKATVDPIIWCGKCAACQAGHYPACTSLKLVGIDLDGGFAEYVAVPPHMVHKIPDHVPDELAALTEILSIGFHACSRSGLGPQDDVLIMGAGKVGQSILQAAKTITSGRIFIADILEGRLKIAGKAFPDVVTIDARLSDAAAFVKEMTGGRGVDVAFEAVGHETRIEGRHNPARTCIQAIRGGGTVCVLGLGDQPAAILLKELIWKEGRIMTSRVSHGEFSRVIDALSGGLIGPECLITKILPLEAAAEGFGLLESDPGNQLKILLKVG